MAKASKPRVLVADAPEGIRTLEVVLGGKAEILSATTLERALKRLKDGVDLVVCGVHFDDSRMFDLLRMAKADERGRTVPFVCYRDLESRLPDLILEGLEIASKAMGAEEFVDLFSLKSKHGVPEADERFRRMLLRLLLRELP